MTESEIANLDRDSILVFLKQHQPELKAMGVQTIGLFGSYARGEQSDTSDVDFLFTMEDMTWVRWMDLWNWLEDNLGLQVDLVPEKDLREELKPQVMAEITYAALS